MSKFITNMFQRRLWLHISSLYVKIKKTSQHMSNQKCLNNMPSINEKTFKKWQCPICAAMKIPKFPSNLESVLLNLEPGQLLYFDFAFLNEVNVCGFQSYLSCMNDVSAYSFIFPTQNKHLPIDLLQFVVLNLQQQDKQVNFV